MTLLLQYFSAPILLFVSCCFSFLPILQELTERSKIIFSILNAGAGGIFLGSGMLHMIPDSLEAWKDIVDSDYPFALLLAGGGFFMTMWLEVFLSPGHEALLENIDVKSHPHLKFLPVAPGADLAPPKMTRSFSENDRGRDRTSRSRTMSFPSRVARPESPDPFRRSKRKLPSVNVTHHSPKRFGRTQKTGINDCSNYEMIDENCNHEELLEGTDIRIRYHGHLFEQGFKCATSLIEKREDVKLPNLVVNDDIEDNNRFMSALIFLLTLSIHSFVVGLSSGASSDEDLQSFGITFFGLIVHKASASTAMGITMRKANLSKRHALSLLFLFGCSTPTGVLVGVFLSDNLGDSASQYLTAIFLSIGAGSFIYLAIMENLMEEFMESQSWKKSKYLACVFGFGIMAGLAILG